MEPPSENTAFVSRNILDNRRTVTNPKMLIFFLICLLIWIPIVIYGFSAGNGEHLSPTNNDYPLKTNSSTKISIAIGYVLLCGFFSILFYIILRWVPNISYVTFIAIWIQLIGAILAVNEYVNFSQVQTVIGSALGVIVMHVIISAEWFHLPESLIKESCKVMRSVPSTILFAAVSYFISLLIAAITFVAFLYLASLSGTTSILLMYADILIGFWLCLLSLGICSMTLFATYSAWYWAVNKNEVSFGTVLRSLKIIIRYHIGTLAYGTSIFGALRTLWSLITRVISYRQEHGATLNDVTYIVYNFFDTVVFRFTMIGGLARCASSGSGYYESIESIVNYCETRPKRSLLAVKVMEYVLVFVLSAIAILMIVSLYFVISNNEDYNFNNDRYFLISIVLGSFLFIWAVLTTFSVGYYSVLCCFFEDLEVNDGSESRPYSMSRKLRLALNHEGPPPCIRDCVPHIIDKEE